MARVLAYTTPARGHLYPLVPIVDALIRKGHEVSVRTLADEVAMLRARGVEADAIDARIEGLTMDDWRARGNRAALAAAVSVFAARAPFDADDLAGAIAAEEPDLVLVDINAWGAMAAAEAWGGPYAVVAPFPLALRSRDVPPFGPGLAPARGALGRLRDRLAAPLVVGMVERTMLPPLNRVRETRGLPAVAHYDDLLARAPIVLSLTAEPFEYPRRDWPPNVRMVGPCAWEPPSDPPPWLDGLPDPLIVVTTSSEFQDDGRLVRTALAALADEPVSVVATMPAGVPDDLEVPANARVERFVPHAALLERAACVVTHAGMGATQKALARGIPVCAVPFGRDQFEVARRVEHAHAGTRLPASRLRPDRLRAAVRKAMDMRPGAERVAAGFSAAGGPAAAADALDHLLLQPARGQATATA